MRCGPAAAAASVCEGVCVCVELTQLTLIIDGSLYVDVRLIT